MERHSGAIELPVRVLAFGKEVLAASKLKRVDTRLKSLRVLTIAHKSVQSTADGGDTLKYTENSGAVNMIFGHEDTDNAFVLEAKRDGNGELISVSAVLIVP